MGSDKVMLEITQIVFEGFPPIPVVNGTFEIPSYKEEPRDPQAKIDRLEAELAIIRGMANEVLGNGQYHGISTDLLIKMALTRRIKLMKTIRNDVATIKKIGKDSIIDDYRYEAFEHVMKRIEAALE